MAFRVKKPHDRFFRELEGQNTVRVDDTVAGLYFLRLNKCQHNDSFSMETIRHNRWIMAKKKPFHRSYELKKYTIFE